MRKAARWWGLTLVIAAVPGLLVQIWLRPRPEQAGMDLVRAEVPQAWGSLPIIARLTDEVFTTSDNGCSEGYGTFNHEGKLGRFRVRWRELMIQGRSAGPAGWSAAAPELRSACPSVRQPGPGDHVDRPDTLREDAATGIYVLEGYGEAMAACREEGVVISPAHEVRTRDRVAASGVIVALVLAASGLWRRRVGLG
jgi:hypothetical protein